MNQERKAFIISGGFLILIAFLFLVFLQFHETRVDYLEWGISDPLFPLLPRRDVSLLIIPLTYGTIILYAVYQWKVKFALSRLMLSYGFLILFRIITLSIFPLKEPASIVILQDPFLNTFIYNHSIDSDLFFSGHTGLLLICLFITKKWIFGILAFVLGILLLIQRVHYTVDILGAIPFAYLTVILSKIILNRIVRSA